MIPNNLMKRNNKSKKMNEISKFDIGIIASGKRISKPKRINPFYDNILSTHDSFVRINGGKSIKHIINIHPNPSNDYVWCKNLLCNASPIEIKSNVTLKDLDKMVCKICSYKGFMPSNHILKFTEIVKQINDSRDKILLSEFFRRINFFKLPKSLDQQKIGDK